MRESRMRSCRTGHAALKLSWRPQLGLYACGCHVFRYAGVRALLQGGSQRCLSSHSQHRASGGNIAHLINKLCGWGCRGTRSTRRCGCAASTTAASAAAPSPARRATTARRSWRATPELSWCGPSSFALDCAHSLQAAGTTARRSWRTLPKQRWCACLLLCWRAAHVSLWSCVRSASAWRRLRMKPRR